MALACLACGSAGDQSQPTAAPTEAAGGTNITVAGDSTNHYPTVHVTKVECGNPGSASAFIGFLLPKPGPPSTIQSELLINLTATRASALTALDTLFRADLSTEIGRRGKVGPVTLQSTDHTGSNGQPLSTGTLTISGTYVCP